MVPACERVRSVITAGRRLRQDDARLGAAAALATLIRIVMSAARQARAPFSPAVPPHEYQHEDKENEGAEADCHEVLEHIVSPARNSSLPGQDTVPTPAGGWNPEDPFPLYEPDMRNRAQTAYRLGSEWSRSWIALDQIDRLAYDPSLSGMWPKHLFRIVPHILCAAGCPRPRPADRRPGPACAALPNPNHKTRKTPCTHDGNSLGQPFASCCS